MTTNKEFCNLTPENIRYKILNLFRYIFHFLRKNLGASTEHGVKHQISRKTNSRKYALVDQRYARVQSSGILNNPLAVLDFLCQMANAADDTNEQLYSTGLDQFNLRFF
jgi:hypothetical protein